MDVSENPPKQPSSTSQSMERIFRKLEDDKTLDRINSLFYTAFLDTTKTILEGLGESMDEIVEDQRSKACYEDTLSLFRTKLSLVAQLMIDNMFNFMVSKKTPRLESRKSLNIDRTLSGSGLALIESDRYKEDEITGESMPRERETLARSKPTIKTEKNLKNITSPAKKWKKKESSPNNVKEITYVLRPNKAATPKKCDTPSSINSHRTFNTSMQGKNEASKGAYSRSPSIMQSVLSTTYTNKNNSAFNDKSEKSSPGLAFSPSQTLLNQTVLNQTTLNQTLSSSGRHRAAQSMSFVQSEFNYVRGPVTFGHSPRKSWVDAVARTDSPGPGKYDIPQRNNSPSPSIGRAPRVCWVDIVARNDSPGPGAYHIPSSNRSPRMSIGKAPRVPWIDTVSRTESPGPGTYELPSTNTSPRLSIGKAPRIPWIDVIAKTDSPGPGKYDIPQRNNSPSPSIGRAPRVCWVDIVARTDSPGPGTYHIPSSNRSPRISIGKATKTPWIDVIARNDSPGPATYYPSMHFASK